MLSVVVMRRPDGAWGGYVRLVEESGLRLEELLPAHSSRVAAWAEACRATVRLLAGAI